MLTRKEKEEIITLYDDRFAENGYDITTVGWKSVEEQNLRFKILCDIADLRDRTICDVGCGFGDLIPYMTNRFQQFQYLGIDLSAALIQKAGELHPKYNFQCGDIMESEFNTEFDIFILSGALSFRIENNIAFAKNMIDKMFTQCKIGIAINFLSSYVNFQHVRNFHYSPEEMFAYCKTLTRFVALRHDYPLWEFTVYLYKQSNQ